MLDLLVQIIENCVVFLERQVVIHQTKQFLFAALVDLHDLAQLFLKRSQLNTDLVILSGIPVDLYGTNVNGGSCQYISFSKKKKIGHTERCRYLLIAEQSNITEFALDTFFQFGIVPRMALGDRRLGGWLVVLFYQLGVNLL